MCVFLGSMMLFLLLCCAISFLGKTLSEITKYNSLLEFWNKVLKISLISYLGVVVCLIIYLLIINV